MCWLSGAENDSFSEGNEIVTIEEDSTLDDFDITENNKEGGQEVIAVLFKRGLQGTLGGEFIDKGSGKIDYRPIKDFFGNDTLFYSVCTESTSNRCDDDTLIVRISPRQDVPKGGSEKIFLYENVSQASIGLLSNNKDPDGDPLVIDLAYGVVGTGGGIFDYNGDGTIDYTPAPDHSGTDTLLYKVCDNSIPRNCITDTLVIFLKPERERLGKDRMKYSRK
ncbi:MAG: Ig-like domain-containing protein [Flavobacteriales bacterium]|nr:Ig-like domain-containing protein [Flavobacteriales bacterium]